MKTILGVKIKKSTKDGPIIAIMTSIHGNEQVGSEVLKKFKNFKPTRGTVIFIIGNPKALKKKERFFQKDLNRCFLNTNGKTYEDVRAREIRTILKKCDALLDIHSYDPDWGVSYPFLICESESLEVAKKLNNLLITTNWKSFHKGSTDHLMSKQKKVGICLESGPHNLLKQNTQNAYDIILRFLSYYDLMEHTEKQELRKKQKIIHLKKPPFTKNGKIHFKI